MRRLRAARHEKSQAFTAGSHSPSPPPPRACLPSPRTREPATQATTIVTATTRATKRIVVLDVQDCCLDFVKTCGAQKKTNTKNSQRLWKCLAVGDWNAHYQNVDTYCRLNGPSGIWMIANCSRNWALDETRTRCENAPDKFSFPVEDFLPVVGKNGFTYRNKHCAECNKETSYQSWDIVLEGPVTPPKEYNLDDRLRFVSENRGKIRPTKPGKHMPRRYCAGARYVDSCPNTSHPAYQECLNGPVETVGDSNRGYFKNEACTLCNRKTTISEERTWLICSADSATEIFLMVLTVCKQTNSEPTVKLEVKDYNCPTQPVYDDDLEYCSQGVITKIDDTFSDMFFIVLWIENGTKTIPTNLQPPDINDITKHLKSGLAGKFALKPNQLTEFQFHLQYSQRAATVFVATFYFTLTPYQEYIFANKNNTSNLKISTESQKFLGLLKFTTNFTMQSGGYRFPVIKLVFKQLACF